MYTSVLKFDSKLKQKLKIFKIDTYRCIIILLHYWVTDVRSSSPLHELLLCPLVSVSGQEWVQCSSDIMMQLLSTTFTEVTTQHNLRNTEHNIALSIKYNCTTEHWCILNNIFCCMCKMCKNMIETFKLQNI